MKTVHLSRDFSYRVKRHTFVQYRAGHTYPRVPEAAVRAIVDAGAGEILASENGITDRDARECQTPR